MKVKLLLLFCLVNTYVFAQKFQLTDGEYFNCEGVDVMAFSDFYPEGHQGGISIIMNGKRIASNGDIRLESTPGQWQAVPKQISRKVENNSIVTNLCYPDSSRHLTGFNPMIYPDLIIEYSVRLQAKDDGLIVSVDLKNPIPEKYIGKVGFNMEFFPGLLFGKTWLMDDKSGFYPQQANGPLQNEITITNTPGDFHIQGEALADISRLKGNGYSPIVADDIIAMPYAEGKKFTSRPDEILEKITIENLNSGNLKLYDGRLNHNNGWFVLRSQIEKGATKNAICWKITPSICKEWIYKPVIQTSQIGYKINQNKQAIVECDVRDKNLENAKIYKITHQSEELVLELKPENWGKFLRYNYLKIDFSSIKESGLYKIKYKDSQSSIFRIDNDVFDRGVWQPVVEYFLPVQMCHMRVNEKYRVWHDLCHNDDALMAQQGNHFDGYNQQAGNWKHKAGEKVEGVNRGGWHDAGDFDLRIESQANECYILSLAFEEFQPQIDVTAIDQKKQICEIHQSDNKNDILQQIEHGAISIVSGYQALGRLYRGIICNNLRQYAMLGDAAAMTDGIKSNSDDRWIFTEQNPNREITTAAQLATTSRVLKGFNDSLSLQCLSIAKELFDSLSNINNKWTIRAKLMAASQLYITTKEEKYLNFLLQNTQEIEQNAKENGLYFFASVEKILKNSKNKKIINLCKTYKNALLVYRQELQKNVNSTPYGVPYQPSIWGAGWNIQSFGFEHYFLAKTYPEIFDSKAVSNALNFVLGCHPGSNTASFASGVGAKSAIVGYGLNRADWSYIPGGVISGTALIRPNFPELLEFPFLWQQTEYVLGGGSSHYMFLVLAVRELEK